MWEEAKNPDHLSKEGDIHPRECGCGSNHDHIIEENSVSHQVLNRLQITTWKMGKLRDTGSSPISASK